MKIHKKQISAEEAEIVNLINELSLKKYTLIQACDGNTLIEWEGCHVNRLYWNITQLYNDAVRPFHNITVPYFTKGIYSFMGTGEDISESDYRKYIDVEVKHLIARKFPTDPFVSSVYLSVRNGIKELIQKNIRIDRFCLLHGDLYNGNILWCNNRYALIDFEFLRFGPPEIEWAFFLFWDLITEKNVEMRGKITQKIVEELFELRKENLLSYTQEISIVYVFVPIILSAALHYCGLQKYEDSNFIRRGIEIFWTKEYKTIQKAIR